MFDWVKKELRDFNKISPVLNASELKEPLNADVAFIGAGLSSTFTLIELIKEISLQELLFEKRNLKIAVFEKDDWIWGGIPYGKRSSFTSLIITPLDEFLPQSELKSFTLWMKDNFDWLIKPFNDHAGSRSKAWLMDCEDKIKNNDSNRIHIPRYFFGIYLWDKLRETLLLSNVKIDIKFINEEVISVNKLDQKSNMKFQIGMESFNICANQVMLGIGIPNIRTLFEDGEQSDGVLLVNDPYSPDLLSTIQNVQKKILQNKKTKILIVGANASALELIYQITNFTKLPEGDFSFTVLSPQGKVPDFFIKDFETDFEAKALNNLSKKSDVITADEILEALKEDLDFADRNGYGISETLPVFTGYVGTLVNCLENKEKLKFISFHGVEIGRLQRRAGYEYTQPIKELEMIDKIDTIKGKFNKVLIDNDMKTFVEIYKKDSDSSELEKFDVVINCSGSSGLSNKNLSKLLKQLTGSRICVATESNHGLKVGDNFEVESNFYINGPLLAGNIVGEMGIWHVEHCGRIIGFSKKIASSLLDNLRR